MTEVGVSSPINFSMNIFALTGKKKTEDGLINQEFNSPVRSRELLAEPYRSPSTMRGAKILT